MPASGSDAFTLLRQITEQSLDRDLEREEVIQVRNAIYQHLVPLMDHPRKIFVLGSYDEDEKTQLEFVQRILNCLYRVQGSSRARVYLMEEIPGEEIWINLDIKFRLLASVADHLVGVTEHDRGGFMFEQGIIATNKDFRHKTLLLKREYPTIEEEHEHYSAMQSVGLFENLDNQGRIFRWQTPPDLIEEVEEVFQHIESDEDSG
jgi:hypothetical protein